MFTNRVRQFFHRKQKNEKVQASNEKTESKKIVHPYLKQRNQFIERTQSQPLTVIRNTSTTTTTTTKPLNIYHMFKKDKQEPMQSTQPQPIPTPTQPTQPTQRKWKTQQENTIDKEVPSTINQIQDTTDYHTNKTNHSIQSIQSIQSYRLNSVPLKRILHKQTQLKEKEREQKKRELYIHHFIDTPYKNDYMYQSIIQILLWYRSSTISSTPIQQPYQKDEIQMIEKHFPWNVWIEKQIEFRNQEHTSTTTSSSSSSTSTSSSNMITPSSYPSSEDWYNTFYKQVDKSIEKEIQSKEKLPDDLRYIHHSKQWLFEMFCMGSVVIPRMHITTCLMIDSMFLLDWPFLFVMKDKKLYPIMNSSCATDWIQEPSKLEMEYIQRRRNTRNMLPRNTSQTFKSEQIVDKIMRKYDCLIDNSNRKQCTFDNIQVELKQMDYIIVPFWTKNMMETLRHAMFKMMSHPYSKKSSLFSKTWYRELEEIFAFYEREFLFL